MEDMATRLAAKLAINGEDGRIDFGQTGKLARDQGGIFIVGKFLTEKMFNTKQVAGGILSEWKLRGTLKVSQTEGGRFVLRFDDHQDAQDFIDGGPMIYRNSMMVAQVFDGMEAADRIPLDLIPLWVEILGLKEAVKTEKAMELLGEVRGTYVKFDPFKFDQGVYRIRYLQEVGKPLRLTGVFCFDGIESALEFRYLKTKGVCWTCGWMQHPNSGCPGPQARAQPRVHPTTRGGSTPMTVLKIGSPEWLEANRSKKGDGKGKKPMVISAERDGGGRNPSSAERGAGSVIHGGTSGTWAEQQGSRPRYIVDEPESDWEVRSVSSDMSWNGTKVAIPPGFENVKSSSSLRVTMLMGPLSFHSPELARAQGPIQFRTPDKQTRDGGRDAHQKALFTVPGMRGTDPAQEILKWKTPWASPKENMQTEDPSPLLTGQKRAATIEWLYGGKKAKLNAPVSLNEPMAIDFEPELAIPSNGAGALVISPQKTKRRGRKLGSKNKPKATWVQEGQGEGTNVKGKIKRMRRKAPKVEEKKVEEEAATKVGEPPVVPQA